MPIADFSDRSLAELTSLAGRRAVVTGGARGIGLQIARRLAEAGASIAICDLDEAAARGAASDIKNEYGVEAAGLLVDVTNEQAVVQMVAEVRAHGPIHVWVNNAGVYPASPLLQIGGEDWDHVLNVNLRGTFLGAREAARHMIADSVGGVIINLASVAAYRGRPGQFQAHYAAAKHGVLGMTKSLAAELGIHGIRVLGIAPTITRTPGIEKRNRTSEGGVNFDGLAELIVSRLPLGRAAVPDDIARVALFCASDMSSYMTGSTLLVDAGDLTIG